MNEQTRNSTADIPHPNLQITSLSISSLSDAHVSDHLTRTIINRHDNSRTAYSSESVSPTGTILNSGPPSHESSPGSSVTNFSGEEQEPLQWLKFRLASGFFAYFLCGWGDGVTGTVLPYFAADYHLNTMTSSLLFTGSTCGFFVGTFIVERLMTFLGQCSEEHSNTSLIPYVPWMSSLIRKREPRITRYSASQARHLSLVFSSLLHAVFFVMVGQGGGYAVTFIAYAVSALARSFITATLNAYYVSGPPQSAFGYAYGLWSVGGVISPIVCQTVIARGVPWNHFYFGSLVLSGINCTLLFLAFRPTAQESTREWREAMAEKSKVAMDEKFQRDVAPLASRSNTLRVTLKMPYQWAFSIFALLYSGNETTTQGFMVTYLLGTRHANPKTVGYVTSGYWGGFALARFIWGYFVPRSTFTQRKFIVLGCFVVQEYAPLQLEAMMMLTAALFLALAVVMHILIRVIDSNMENSVNVALIGFLYGPIFPAILRLTNDILPPEVQMISMGLISAFASVGSALFPFISGAISRVKGVNTIPFLTISLGVVLIGIWSLFPTRLPVRTITV